MQAIKKANVVCRKMITKLNANITEENGVQNIMQTYILLSHCYGVSQTKLWDKFSGLIEVKTIK